jgi:hypothetical protein
MDFYPAQRGEFYTASDISGGVPPDPFSLRGYPPPKTKKLDPTFSPFPLELASEKHCPNDGTAGTEAGRTSTLNQIRPFPPSPLQGGIKGWDTPMPTGLLGNRPDT